MIELHSARICKLCTVFTDGGFADDGCIDGSGLVIGTYLHGLFGNENIRYALMSHLHEKKGIEYAPQVEDLRFDGDLVYSIQICIHTDVYIHTLIISFFI